MIEILALLIPLVGVAGAFAIPLYAMRNKHKLREAELKASRAHGEGDEALKAQIADLEARLQVLETIVTMDAPASPRARVETEAPVEKAEHVEDLPHRSSRRSSGSS